VEAIILRLGRRIREIQRGFKSQEEFADYCKLHRTFVGHLETGRKDFRLTTVIHVAEALGVTLQDLFAGLESGKPLQAAKLGGIRQADLDAILRELTALERSIKRLKQYTLADGPANATRQHAARANRPKEQM